MILTQDNGHFCPPGRHSSHVRAKVSSGARCLSLGQNPHLVLYLRVHDCAVAPEGTLFAYSKSTIII